MYCALYNRLCGWILILTAAIGFLFGRVGAYLALSRPENIVCLCLGVIAVWGARARQRYAFLIAAMIGFLVLLWGLWGMFWPGVVLGSAEPLENAIRIVLGAWGLYVALQDFTVWRHS